MLPLVIDTTLEIGETAYCEDCGHYVLEEFKIFLNSELIWEMSHDGHLHAFQTEKSILDCFLDKALEIQIYAIETQYSEQGRLDWNNQCPGNGIADTVENWQQGKEATLTSLKNSIENVRESCMKDGEIHLPHDHLLQLKMIALWYENEFEEPITINSK